jgi:hypothetical protein
MVACYLNDRGSYIPHQYGNWTLRDDHAYGRTSINNGALVYDASANKTSIERLDLGPTTFEDDAGAVSWIDLAITASAPSGTTESYSAQIDSNSILTIYGQADGSGGLKNVRTVVGTSTDAILGSANIPYGSLIIADGALCVDDGQGANCDDAAISRGEIAAETTTIQNIDVAELYPTKDGNLGAGDVVMLDPNNAVFVKKYNAAAVPSGAAPTFVGVISTKPGVLLGGFGNSDFAGETKVPVTLSGRVPVKVNLDGGDIAIGDRLSASSAAGVATRATTSAMTLGIALEPYSASSTAGTVLTFIDLSYSFADNQFYIDKNGNLGVGTTTPQYAIHVLGDVAAQSFINISTASSKKDIEYLADNERAGLLEGLRGFDIAKYRYLSDDGDSQYRLGLIAEQVASSTATSTISILSVSGDGVDLYKLGAATLAGVQELADGFDSLELRIEGRGEGILGTKPQKTLRPIQQVRVSLRPVRVSPRLLIFLLLSARASRTESLT